MNNIYFKELFELAEDFNKFWHRKYYEVNIRGSRTTLMIIIKNILKVKNKNKKNIMIQIEKFQKKKEN